MIPSKPVQLSSSTKEYKLSNDTLNLLLKLKKQGKETADSLSRHSPIPHLLSQREESEKTRISSKEAGLPRSRMFEKHSDLISVKRELVLPVHIKQLIDGSQFIDESLNFIKRCRRQNDGGSIVYSEVKASIEKSYGRTINLSHFRQLLTIVPEFYSHSWEKVKGQQGFQLTIDFGQNENSTKKLDFFEKRRKVLKERLTERCIQVYWEVMEKKELGTDSLV